MGRMFLGAAQLFESIGAIIGSGGSSPSGGGAVATFHILTEGGDNLAAENGDLLRTE